MAGGDRQAGSPVAPTDAHPAPEPAAVPSTTEPAAPTTSEPAKEPSPPPKSPTPPPAEDPPQTAEVPEVLIPEEEEEGEIGAGEVVGDVPVDEHGNPLPEFKGWSKTEEDLKRIERALDEFEAKVSLVKNSYSC